MPETALERIRIVLVEPAGARNVGAIARVMKNFGLGHLVLVNPQCDPLSDDARQMAVHAADVLAAAERVATLPEALIGCQRAIATTARSRALQTDLELPADGLPWLLGDRLSVTHSALIFGREDRGLSNEELKYAQRFIRIPSDPIYPSLNLAQAVAVCCYELYLAQQGAPVRKPSAHQTTVTSENPIANPTETENLGIALPLDLPPPASLDEIEGYYQQLEAVLLKIGYLYPHTATSRMEKFRRLFNRSSLSKPEVAMLRGILSQVEWALQKSPLNSTTLLVPDSPDDPPLV